MEELRTETLSNTEDLPLYVPTVPLLSTPWQLAPELV